MFGLWRSGYEEYGILNRGILILTLNLGMKESLTRVGPGIMTQSAVECSVCDGTGSFFHPKDKCKKCKGKQVTEGRKMLEIYIPRGAKCVSLHSPVINAQ